MSRSARKMPCMCVMVHFLEMMADWAIVEFLHGRHGYSWITQSLQEFSDMHSQLLAAAWPMPHNRGALLLFKHPGECVDQLADLNTQISGMGPC